MVDPESARRQTAQISRAPRDVVDTSADRALKVMVMREFPHFVTGGLPGQGYRAHRAFGDEQLQIAIDRCDAERADFQARRLQIAWMV